jgi:hypothetical protein
MVFCDGHVNALSRAELEGDPYNPWDLEDF